jgi:phosphatidylserine/phosphatidylglycerophosphate/cardiolipin synthase-like enzyme/uncharacterized membrane protein YbhN (UPF0104 family)
MLRAYDGSTVALALGCTAFSFLTLGLIEIVTLRAVGAAGVPRRKAVATAFVAHTFSQSIGVALLSGAAVRIRAYATDAMNAVTVARVTALVTATVSMGLLAVVSVALLGVTSIAGLRIPYRPIGTMLISVVVLYLGWSLFARRRTAHETSWLAPPPLQSAAALIALSAADWLLTGAVLFVILTPAMSFSYPAFVAVQLVAQTIGMLSHVPGGAGIFEATLLSVLAPAVDSQIRGGLVASLLLYRFVYYLVPLGAALLVAAAIEGRSRSRYSRGASGPTKPVPTELARPVDSRESGLEWLIDNAEAYDRMLQSIATAQHSVWMTQLAFDADCIAYERDAPRDSASWGAGTVLAETLLAAVARAPVDVRILLNATLLLDTTGPLHRFFAARLGALNGVPGTVGVRGLSRFPQLLHSKMVIVDGKEAFLLGSPFANGYWDDSRHAPVDPRRPARELGGRPLHDVSVRVTGAAVGELQRIFEELWTLTASGRARDLIEEAARTTTRAPRPGAPTETAAAPVQIVCTSPARVFGDDDGGSTQIIEALLKGIAGSRSLIYVEHQYLSARPVAAALAQALRREPDLELIVVLNQNPDVTAYQRWQNARLAESGLLQHPQTGIFALWSAALDARNGGPAALNQVFVHSKVVIVDDLWATSGSANLDGVSLHSYGDDFTGGAARRVFRNVRNFDVNVVVRDDHGPGTVADLRARLWAEHLALPAESLERRPPEGWLPLWRKRAAANVAALARPGGADAMRGFVLPYSVQRTPALQLADLGVPIDPARIDLRFNPGWLEVQFSPNWARNMFG